MATNEPRIKEARAVRMLPLFVEVWSFDKRHRSKSVVPVAPLERRRKFLRALGATAAVAAVGGGGALFLRSRSRAADASEGASLAQQAYAHCEQERPPAR